MVTKTINEYTTQELDQISTACPAVGRYLKLISNAPKTFSDSLRIKRHKYWLQSALSSFFENDSTENICKFWSEKSEELIRDAFKKCGLAEKNFVILALGKLGAEELNLSSDVDLIILSNSELHKESLKKIKTFNSLLSDNTEFGFCLRVDFNLRPGGRFSQLVCNLSQFSNHYWSQGETCERLAFVRGRVITTVHEENKTLSFNLQKTIQKFTYRKFLDYTLFDDLKTLRTQIQEHNLESDEKGFDLKLGIGGIRDIELYIHSLLVIHGGKNTKLQTHSTSLAVKSLGEENILEPKVLKFLIETYWYYRRLENLTQIKNDQQTHIWCGPLLEVHEKSEKIQKVVVELLGEYESKDNLLPRGLDQQKKWLAQAGFSNQTIESVWPEIIQLTAKSLKGRESEVARRHFLFLFVTEVIRIDTGKDLGLFLLLDFIRATHAKSSFFHLLIKEQLLLKDLAQLFCSSPYLGGIISSRPELLDGFLFRQQEKFSKDLGVLLEQLTEKRLLTELISSSQFLSDHNIKRVTEELTQSADDIALTLLSFLKKEYGPSSVQLIALGKWGGREMGFKSDLDFLFVTPSSPNQQDYKVAKRFVSRLTDRHKGGCIFEVDLRLRPSGNAGPLIVSEESLKSFLQTKAPVWQKQSYLRLRPLYDCKTNLREPLISSMLSDEDVDELMRIREELLRHPTNELLDIKYAPGGLIDIEFAVQIYCLRQQIKTDNGNTLYLIDEVAKIVPTAKLLPPLYLKLRQLEQLNQLLSSTSSTELRWTSENVKRLQLHGILEASLFKHQLQELLSSSLRLLKSFDSRQLD